MSLDAVADHWVALLALAAYAALLAHNAYLGRMRSTTTSDYYVGGRRFGGTVIGVSFFATFASTNSYIGHAGKGYAYGLPWMSMVLMVVVFTYLSWRFVAPRMRRLTLAWSCLTLPDFIVSRFAGHGPQQDVRAAQWLRVACALVIVFSSLLYLVAVFKGAGNLFQIFLGVEYQMAVAITLVVVVAYTSVGGFHSVVRTDFVQGLLMFFAAITMFYCVTQAAGGIGVLSQMSQAPQTAHLFTADAGIPLVVLLGIALAGSLKLLVDPRQLSRFYGLRDEASVRQGLWIALIGIGVVLFCLFPIGIYAHQLVTDVTDTDMIMPMLINDPTVFPPWVADLLIVAIVAAAMSSMDSVLLVAASVVFNDLVEPWAAGRAALRQAALRGAGAELNPSLQTNPEPNPHSDPYPDPLFWTRCLVVLVACLGALFALNPPGGIVEITVFAGSLYAVCFVPAILLGLHWLKGDAVAVLTSMLSGVVVLVLWLTSGAGQVVHEVFPALAVSLSVYCGVALRRRAVIQQWPDTPPPGSPDEY